MRYRLTARGKILVFGISIILLSLVCLTAYGILTMKRPVPNAASASKSATPASAMALNQDIGEKAGPDGVPSGYSLTFRCSIFFGPDGCDVTQESVEILKDVKKRVSALPAYFIVLEGSYNAYPDLNGEYFEKLSKLRAHNALEYLAGIGIDRSKMHEVSIGSGRQLNKDTSKPELAKNRRVDISIYSK